MKIRMMKTSILFFTLSIALFALSGKEIIARVDGNQVYNSIEYHATMTISMGKQVREKSFEGYAQGDEQAYMEFTAPAREKGTRFLKLADEMWMYIPSVEKATKIAGHMLRQSLMGSDFSYDDFTENKKMLDAYDIEVLDSDTFLGTECYVLELTAKIEEVSYYKRRLWVSKENYIPLKTELFAKSGKLMKELKVLEVKKIGTRHYPVHIRMENKLRKDTFTELIFEEIKIDVPIPEKVFTKAFIERK